MDKTAELQEEIAALEKSLREKEQQLARLRRKGPHEPVEDFVLEGRNGQPAPLSSFFGDHKDLVVIHNMGSGCPYCTLWADGFNGVIQHLENRAGFVVVSPDPPDVQASFAAKRGWQFHMASNADSGFTQAMGYSMDYQGRTYYKPGCSTFRLQDDGSIVRVAHVQFGPGDPYCAPWHIFALLAEGSGHWEPKFDYRE